MARQQMNPVPYEKHMEAYNDFSGGLNTVTSNENLRDNEFPDLVNVDLGDRGSVKRRSGMRMAENYVSPTKWTDIQTLKWSDV